MKIKRMKWVAVICAAALFAETFSGVSMRKVSAAASDYPGQSNVFLDSGGYKTEPYGTVTSDYGNSYKNRADVLPKRENIYLTQDYENLVATVPTSDWASSVVFDRFSESLYVHPMAFRATSMGMEMATPAVVDVRHPTDQEPAVESLLEDSSVELVMGGNGFTAEDARIDGATDWTYDISMKNSAGTSEILTTLAKGSPYVYYRFNGVTPALSLGGGATNMAIYQNDVNANNIGISVQNTTDGATHYYGIYASGGTTWSQADGKLTANLLAGKEWITVAALPDKTAETFQLYGRYAANRISDTRVDWNYNEAESKVTTVYQITTTNLDNGQTGGDTIIALYPHQWRYAVDAAYTGRTYRTIRGTMKTMVGKKFTTEMTYSGILAAMPTPASEEGLGTLKDQISYFWDYYENTMKGTYSEAGDFQYGGYDTYWMGKNLNKRADIVFMAEQLEDSGEDWKKIKTDVLSALEEELEYWFNPADCYTVEQNPYITGFFYYYDDFGTLIGYNSSYSTDSELNDHHFHYGYWIKAAAAVARYVDGWEKEWGAMVYEMISDIANPNRDGTNLNVQRTDASINSTTKYPFLRNFDIYEGHSWASGVANYEFDEEGNMIDPAGGLAGGNNQESTSEAINAWSSLILWGEAVGDERIRDLGVYLYTTEMAAVEEYYFDVHDEVFTDAYEDRSSFNQHVVTRLFGGRYDHSAWWTEDPIEVTSIHMIPMTGATLYFSKYQDKVKATYESIWGTQWSNYLNLHQQNGWQTLNSPYVHQDLLAEFYAMADPQAAMEKWSIEDIPGYGTVIEAGESRAHTYGFIRSMIEYGTPNFNVTGSTAMSMVFEKEDGTRTYVAQNFSDQEKNVYFSDGTFITVPAGSSYAGDKTGDGENPDLKGKVSYIVEVYLENTDGTGYEKTTSTKKAQAGEFTLTPEEIQGFTFDDGAENELTATLVEGEDNQVTLKVYYKRNRYAITYELNKGNNAAANPDEYIYGTQLTLLEPEREGYRFEGWYLDEGFTQPFTGLTETTVGAITLYAKWVSETSAAYAVRVYLQKPGRNGYTEAAEEVRLGEIGEEVTFSYTEDTTGFTLNEEKSQKTGIVQADGSLELSLYYDRNVYSVTYYNLDGAVNAYGNAATYVYGVGMTLATPYKEGYTFAGWYTDAACTAGNEITEIAGTDTEAKEIYAKWTQTPEPSGGQEDTNNPHADVTFSYNAETKHVTMQVNRTNVNSIICYIAKYEDGDSAKKACTDAVNALPGISLPGHFGVALPKGDNGFSKEITEFTIEEGQYIVFGLNLDGSINADSAYYYARIGGDSKTSYTVQHLKQTLAMDSYQLAEQKVIAGAVPGDMVTAEVQTYDGFTFDEGNSTVSGEVKADGGLVLSLYYNRASYAVHYENMENARNAAANLAEYLYGAGMELEAPEKDGFIFEGWYTDPLLTEESRISAISDTQSGELTVYAKWTQKQNPENKAAYTIRYYQQNLTLDGYDEVEGDRVNGWESIDKTITAEIKNYPGFTCNANAAGSLHQGNIPADGSLELRVYYDRNHYAVTYENVTGDENPSANQPEYVYGIGMTLQKPEREGYAFGGWYTDKNFASGSRISAISKTRLGDITLYAKWTQEQEEYVAKYTIEYYLQDPDLEQYVKAEKDTRIAYAVVGTDVQAPDRIYEGFTRNSKASQSRETGTVAADGSLVLRVYYDRNIYKITYQNMEGASFAEEAQTQYVYGVGIPLSAAFREGYRFEGWYTDRNLTDAARITSISGSSMGDITVYAKWIFLDAEYQVKYFLQNKALNDYEEVTTDARNIRAQAGDTVTAPVKDYTGFEYVEALSTVQGEVQADNSLVLEVYYDRACYSVQYHNMEAATNPDGNGAEYIYGIGMALLEPSKTNFVFGGWYTDAAFTEENKIAAISTEQTGEFHVYAKWIDPGQAASYSTEYYLQNLELDGYDLIQEERLTGNGTIGEHVSAPGKNFKGFTKNPEAEGFRESGEVAADGSLVLKVYYDRNKYDIVYHNVEDAVNPEANSRQYVYGLGLALSEPSRRAYSFEGWYLDAEFTSAKKVTGIGAEQTGAVELYAKWINRSELLWTVEEIKDCDYTGKKITPAVVVKDKETGRKLQPGRDYSVKYQNNVKAGTATVVVTGKGNYTGSKNIPFRILPVDISADETVTAENIYKSITGKPVKMSPVVKWGNKKLKLNRDFRIDTSVEGSAASYTKEGEYELILTGIGNYTGSLSVKAVLYDKRTTVLISKATVTGIVNLPYTGSREYTQNIAVSYKGTPLREGVHYEVEYRNNTQAGTAQLIIKGLSGDSKLKFTGTKTFKFKIQGQKLKAGNVYLDQTSFVYTGAEIEPVVTVVDTQGHTVSAEQYTVKYTKNVNKGKGTVTVTGIREYEGTVKKTFTITALAVSDSQITKEIENPVSFVKGGTKAAVTLTYNGEVLSEGVDYTLKYTNNRKTGTGTVTISGKGNFGGKSIETFTIGKKDLSEVTLTASDILYAKNKKMKYYFSRPVLLDTGGKPLAAGTDYGKEPVYELQESDGTYRKIDAEADGSLIVPGSILRVTVTGTGNYCGARSALYRVIEPQQSIKDARITIAPQVYTGREITLTKEDIVSVEVKRNGSYVELSPDQYELVQGSYKNNIKTGTAKVTVKGIGEYGGYREASFKIQSKDIQEISFISRILNWLRRR